MGIKNMLLGYQERPLGKHWICYRSFWDGEIVKFYDTRGWRIFNEKNVRRLRAWDRQDKEILKRVFSERGIKFNYQNFSYGSKENPYEISIVAPLKTEPPEKDSLFVTGRAVRAEHCEC